ncbi:MAG: zinc ribbon domain-containing protein [Anaerolineaceae bacterium]|nr:zinc ribbon domain-containing protein [Anaerolineaceae bacterium]
MGEQFTDQFVRWDTFSSALWYRTKAGRYRLEGTRCSNCGEIYFPPRTGLICPACHERLMEPYQCAQTGSIVTVAPDDVGFPALGYGENLPRIQAIVRLDDGIHLMTDIIQVADPAEVQPGARVKMILRKHKREDTGAWVYGFGFILDP